MRILFIIALGVMLSWTPAAWAKTIKLPKGSTNVGQLHDELLARFPQWQGTPQTNGSFADPLLRVEHTDQEIRLSVPDDADEAAIQSVVKAHQPKPQKDHNAIRRSAKKKLKDLGLTDDELAEIIGED